MIFHPTGLSFYETSAKNRTSLEADTWNGKSLSLKGQNLAELELHNAKAYCGSNGIGTIVLSKDFVLVLQPIIWLILF